MLQREHYAILLTFIKLPVVIKIFVLSIFEWLFYTDFTVFSILMNNTYSQTFVIGKIVVIIILTYVLFAQKNTH